MGYIYKITNTTNGKSYIGQTVNKPEKRLSNHFSNSNCRVLHNAIQKYGRDAFTLEILHEALDIFLDDLEVAEINKHNTLAPNGYNIEGGGHANKVVSDQTRKKISDANKARKYKPHSPEARQKISEAGKGRKHSPETRQKISEAGKGRTHTLETRQKMSEAGKGRTHTLETRQKMSESRKGRKCKPFSPEHRRKLSESAKRRECKPHSPETRRKISNSLKGRKCKPHSPETRRKMSLSRTLPERITAFEILHALPQDMSLAERRKHLRNKFPERPYDTIRSWVRQWSETSASCN